VKIRSNSTQIFALAIMVGCSGGGQHPVAPPANGIILNPVLQKDTNCPNGSLLTYENFGEAFLTRYCTDCHARDLTGENRFGAPEEINLDRPQDVSTWRSLILTTAGAGEKSSMPPGARNISSSERSRLVEWLNCGGSADVDTLTSDLE
jgi:hypothetical protein